MAIPKIFLLIYLSFLFSPYFIACASDDKDGIQKKSLKLLPANPKIVLATVLESIGEEEKNNSWSQLGSNDNAQENKNGKEQDLNTTLSSLQKIRREKPVCHCKRGEEDESDLNSNSISKPNIVRRMSQGGLNSTYLTLPKIVRRMSLDASNGLKTAANTLLAYSSTSYFGKESLEEDISEKIKQPINEKMLKEIEERNVKNKVAKRIEKEKKLEEKFHLAIKQEYKDKIIDSFTNLTEFATQKQVFKLISTANIQEDAKEFVYTTIYYLFLLDVPHHPFGMVNQGWICIRNRFEAAIDGQDQMKEMNFSPLYSHRRLIKRIDLEFGKKIIKL